MSSQDIAAMFDLTAAADREAARRMKVYGCWNAAADLLRILALYPEFWRRRTRRRRADVSAVGWTLRRASCISVRPKPIFVSPWHA